MSSTRIAPPLGWLLRPPVAAPSSPLVAARSQQAAARAMCDLHRIEIRVEGNPPTGPLLFVANHVGYFDPMVIGALAPCMAVAKRELLSWPVVGWRLRELGVVFVDRSSRASGAVALRAIVRALRRGASVLNFPEGTTTDGATVLPFRRGAFGAARIAGVPIVPVRIDYDDARIAWTGSATFLPHYLGVVARGSVGARVAFGRPIQPHRSQSPGELAQAAREVIRTMSRR